MENRFKSRIWNGSEMHYNDFVVTATGYVGKITEEFLGNCVFNQTDLTADKECILMQCTGLKDENGKLIFEGDIVKWGETEFIIVWQKCQFALKKDINQKPIDYSFTSFKGDELEKIGNIYETPELLKDGE